MRKLARHSHAALMGFVFAVGAFSYAMVTTASGTPTGGAGGTGVVGTSLRFTNPTAPRGAFDLGDAAVGFPFVGFAQADGGFQPYVFSDSATTFGSSSGTLNVPTAASYNKELVVRSNGLVTSLANLTNGFLNAAGPFGTDVKVFGIKVTDAVGSNVTGAFQIRMLTADQVVNPRFAVSALPNGQTFKSYAAQIPVLGGKAPYKFAVSTTDAATLTAFGLTLNTSTGTIFGRPIKAGAATFTVTGTDANSKVILARDGVTTTGQLFTLTVTANQIVQNDAVTAACSIKINTKKAGNDTLAYSAQVNGGGDGHVRVVVGNFDSDAVLGGTGIVLSGGKFKSPSKTTPTVNASLSKTGLLKVTIGKTDLSKLFSSTNTAMGVGLTVADAIQSNEFLSFTSKSSSAGFSLTYNFGKSTNNGGVFLVTVVTGKDSKDGSGDAWTATFVAIPGAGQTVGSAAGILVGTNGKETLSSSKAGKFTASDKATLTLNKGKGTFKTATLKSTDTGLPTASKGGTGIVFSTQVNFDTGKSTGLVGNGAKAIKSKGKGWSSK